MPEPKLTVVHVDTHKIKRNRVRMANGKGGPMAPPLTAKPKAGGKAETANTFAIIVRGEEVARVVYRPAEPLKSGAVAWVETPHAVVAVPDGPPPASPLTALAERLAAALVALGVDPAAFAAAAARLGRP